MIRSFARPYARAILQVAGKVEGAETLHGELASFERARLESPELVEVFANPGFSAEAKRSVAGAIAAKLGLSELTGRIIQVLIQNHRINQLGAILEALRAGINEELGRVVAHVRSAHELSAEEREKLQEALEQRFGRKIELDVKTDRSLLGGFVAQLGSEVYDASVFGQLGRLRETLT